MFIPHQTGVTHALCNNKGCLSQCVSHLAREVPLLPTSIRTINGYAAVNV